MYFKNKIWDKFCGRHQNHLRISADKSRLRARASGLGMAAGRVRPRGQESEAPGKEPSGGWKCQWAWFPSLRYPVCEPLYVRQILKTHLWGRQAEGFFFSILSTLHCLTLPRPSHYGHTDGGSHTSVWPRITRELVKNTDFFSLPLELLLPQLQAAPRNLQLY